MYNKAGVVFGDLVPENRVQKNFLGTIDGQKSQRLMQAVDAINTRLPDSALRWAAQRIHQPWRTKFAKRSKRYTTQ